MKLNVTKTILKEIEPLRNLFLHENKFQFVHNKCHENGWADSYLFTMNETKIGYGSVWGKDKREDRDTIFGREKPESDISYDPGEYVLEQNNEIVATGGFVRNYNLPYIDMFMEVKENFRQKGFGSFVVQELKKEAYLKGRVPAARCNIDN